MTRQLNRVPLSDLCTTITSGGTPSRKEPNFWTGGSIPWIKTGELGDWKVTEVGEYITPLGLEKSSAKVFDSGTILMAMYGDGRTITTLGIVDEPSATNQACCAFVANNEKCNNIYLFYALKYHRHELLKLVVAGAQRNLSSGIIKRFSIITWPAKTQLRIAAILSAYDDLIENNRRRIGLLEEAARQLYKEWFVRFRFPGHEHVKVIDGVPEGWEPMELADCIEVVKDSADPTSIDSETPYIGLEHLPRRSITLGEWETAAKVESGKFRYQEHDIIFGRIRPYFHKVGFALNEGITSSDAIVMRARNKANWAIILMEASSDRFVALASQTVKEGSKMPRANWDVLKKHVVVFPPESLKQNFSDQIEAIAAQTKTLSLAITQAAKARDLLLPRLMNGSLTV